MDKTLKFILIVIIIATILIFTISTIIFIKNKTEKEENKPFEIHQNVCFMPRACFDTEQEFKDQFPGAEVPEYYPECLIYCTKNLNSELYPIK